jgi:hypothetical protein
VALETYQRPREKNPSSRSTSTMMRMIQRIDTEEAPFVGVVGEQTRNAAERLRARLTRA